MLLVRVKFTIEALEELTYAVMCSEVFRHLRHWLMTMLAFGCRENAMRIQCASKHVSSDVATVSSRKGTKIAHFPIQTVMKPLVVIQRSISTRPIVPLTTGSTYMAAIPFKFIYVFAVHHKDVIFPCLSSA